MRLLGNIVWFILGGWWNFLLYTFLAAICCMTIIGIPIGKALFQYAKLMVFPFGKVIVKETDIKGKENVSTVRRVFGVIANIIWLPFGVATFVVNIGTMIASAVTIVGIPCAIVIAKSCKFLLWPVGAKVVTKEEAEAIYNQRAANVVSTGQQVLSQEQKTVSSSVPEKEGQLMETVRDNVNKAVSMAQTTYANGQTAIKSNQQIAKEQVLAEKDNVTLEYLLKQMEVKLYENQIMEWIMPYLEYIVCGVVIIGGILRVILNGYSISYLYPNPVLGFIVEFLTGIISVKTLLYIAVVLGVIKRNRKLVVSILGGTAIIFIIRWLTDIILTPPWVNTDHRVNIVYLIEIILALLLLFVCNYILSGKTIEFKLPIRESSWKNTESIANKSQETVCCFCSQCGAPHSSEESFCSQCGAKLI